ncbi:flavoprotein [Nonomuraea rhodomycinica]|uniref:flavoprotein n=1 Tax=Nonomuraea rhodomycinica TaxID=1712872 RepID=UPI0028A83D73|nr:flavoprotein [Nonomuraea rhodomycinica]
MTQPGKVFYIIVCAAGPAADVGHLVTMAQNDGWTVQIVATPAALDFIDVPKLVEQTGRPVRSQYRRPHEPKSPRTDAIIVAPASYNTINKFPQGIADTYASGVLSEAPGLGIPVVVLPSVNSALASRTAFRRSVDDLAQVEILHLQATDFGGAGTADVGRFEQHPIA